MQSRTEKTPVTILLLGLALLLAPPLAAQIDAKGGFVAADAEAGSAKELKEPASSAPRPAPTRPPQAGKIAPFGNLMIVQFEEPPLSRYMGDIPGLHATSPEALGTHELDARSAASQAYLGFLKQRQSEHVSRIEQALSRPIDVVFRYVAGTHGAAIKMSPAERKVVENLPGIVRVFPDAVEHEHTDAGPPWIGADTIWDGSSTGGQGPTEGEGVIVGILDSGVNSSHDYFAEVGDDGFAHQNPFGDGVFVGWCDPSHPDFDPTFPCNNKMIGAWDYADAYCAANPQTCVEDDGPEDDGGHGSHVASTAIGNVLDLTGDGMRDLSGVAPHANVIIYDIAYIDPVSGDGFAPNSAILAAIDQAILDGVDVLNFSYSGGSSPWTDPVELMFLEAKSAGIFVSASAGNDGPGAGTLSHAGPWLITVAANTHDRDISLGGQTGVANQLIDMSGGLTPPADFDGASRTGGYGPAPIVYAGNFSNGDPNPEQCLHPFPPGTWTNQIVLCDRGAIARVMKCQNVADGGAAGCVLANVTDPAPPLSLYASDAHIIPAIHIDAVDGNALRSWLGSGSGHMATITASSLLTDGAQGDIMADFSSRGPNTFDVLKPDVSNPGSLIYAAVDDGAVDEVGLPPFQGLEFNWFSGTSQSSPHTAGSGALLAALHPDWTPLEIKSALMMTADTSLKKENGITDADPWDIGAGRVDLTRASRAGLVLDEAHANFLDADPAIGGAPETLNLASFAQSACVTDCSWTRTLASTASLSAPSGVGVSWTVSSSSWMASP